MASRFFHTAGVPSDFVRGLAKQRHLNAFCWLERLAYRTALKTSAGAVLISLLFVGWPASSLGAGAQYVYDAGGRLVQVVAPDGSSAQYTYDLAGNLLAVTPLSASTAAVTGFSNASAPPGRTITIYGSGFSTTASNNSVYINGVAATIATATANSLVVVVPTSATTGIITVTSPNGTVSSSSNFVVSGTALAPTVSGFSPQIGAAGAAVTVNGSNFQSTASQNKAYFSGHSGAVTSSSATSLSTTVPSSASSGHIGVSTLYGAGLSAADFFVPPTGHVASDIGFTGRLTVGGSSLIASITTGGKIGLVLFDGVAGQHVTLQASNQSFPSSCVSGNIILFSPANANIGSTNFCSGVTAFALPATGTYTLVLTPSGTDTGNITLAMQSVPTVTGAIVIDGSPVTATTTIAGQQAQLTFTTSSANQIVSLQLSGYTYATYCGAGPSWSIQGPLPGSMRIASGSLCAGAQLVTLPVAGIYTITTVPHGTDTGSVTVKLQNAPTITGSIAIDGSPFTVTTTAPAQQGQLTFTTSSANQTVSLQLSAYTYPSYCGAPTWTMRGPSPGTSSVASGNLCAGAQLVTLPTVGTYTISVVPYGMDTGSVTLKLQNAPTVTATATIGGSPVTVTTTVPAQQAQISFSTSVTNQSVTLHVSGSTYPSYCGAQSGVLRGPAPGNSWITNTNLCTGSVNVTLSAVGTYTLTVTPYNMDTGSVTIQLN